MEGRLMIPDLSLQSDISFLVDTGADTTTLFPLDCDKMGIDFSKLPGKVAEDAAGVGGRAKTKTVPATVTFNDPGRKLYVYTIEISVIKPHADIQHIPSLLGRDVLNQWIMRYSYQTRRLTFQVSTADFIYPVHP